MIVGCYSVDLYCDNTEGKKCPSPWSSFPWVYTGETQGECLRQARKAGWRFSRERPRKAYCPKCKRRKK